jgi:hypothetical protein
MGKDGENAMRSIALLIVCVGMAGGAGQSIADENGFDGDWAIEAVVQSGRCVPSYHFPVGIQNGQLTYFGSPLPDVTGGINPGGRVNIRFVRGTYSLIGTGRLQGRSGSGDWSAPSVQCSGQWRAEKK